MFNSATHDLQHTRLSCSSLSPRVTQTHIHWVSDAIQPFHPLSPPSPPDLNLSQHQDLFQWVYCSTHWCEWVMWIRWSKYWSFSFSISPSNLQGWLPLGLTGSISLLSKCLSRVFSNTCYSFWCNCKWDWFHFSFW